MYCENCGERINERANFCIKCGENVNQNKEKIEDKEIVYMVKKTFNYLYMMIHMTQPSTFVIGISLLILSVWFIFKTPYLGIIILFLVLTLFGITRLINMIITKKQYEKISYDFYKTKVIFKDEFLNMSKKEIKYKDIKEITMRQTFLQRKFNLGDIILRTSAEGYSNGIVIVDIENVENEYNKIKKIINL